MKSLAKSAMLLAALDTSGLGAFATSDDIVTEGSSPEGLAAHSQESDAADASSSMAQTSAFALRKEAVNRMPVPERVMNDKVRNFRLEPKDHLMTMPSGNYEPNVFIGVDLWEREQKSWTDFKQWTEGKPMPVGFLDDDRQALRILACSDHDFEETYDKILHHDQDIRDRVVPLINDWTKFEELLHSGIYYGYGRDNLMKPIMWMNVRKLIDSKVSVEDMLDVIHVLHNYVIENAINPGHIETWHIVGDFDGVGFTELPIGAFAQLATTMRANYFVRNQSLSFINVPMLVQIAAKFVWSMVDEFQAYKMQVYGTEYKDFLFEKFGPENLEAKYDGQLPDNTEDFFPPKFNVEELRVVKSESKDQQTEL